MTHRLSVIAVAVAVVTTSAACGDNGSNHAICLEYLDAVNEHRDKCVDGVAPLDDAECDDVDSDLLTKEQKEQDGKNFRCMADAWTAAAIDCSKPVIDCTGTRTATDVADDCDNGGTAAACDPTMDLATLVATLDPIGGLGTLVSVHGPDFLDPAIYSSFCTVEVEDDMGMPIASCTYQYHQGAQDQFCTDVGGVLGANDVPSVVEQGSDILFLLDLEAAGPGPFTVTATTGWAASFTAGIAQDSAEVTQVAR